MKTIHIIMIAVFLLTTAFAAVASSATLDGTSRAQAPAATHQY